MPNYHVEYSSVLEAAEVAETYIRNGSHSETRNGDFNRDFRDFGAVRTWDEAKSLAIDGWASEVPEALSIAEAAIETVDQEHDMPVFNAVWDVTGCQVDVGRFLSGEPENMVDFEIVQAPRHGRVITLCASVAASGAISAETIKRRGRTVVALAMALTRLGFTVELWADYSVATSYENMDKEAAYIRSLVKGANDELDPARIMYAYSHPSSFRAIGFALMHALPEEWQRKIGAGDKYGAWYGYPTDPNRDLPEGTIYLPCVLSDRDVPDAHVALAGYLRDLGIID